MSPPRALRVVVIDDDVQHLELMERNLRREHIDVLTIRNEVGRVTNAVRAFNPDVVLVDLHMPHMPGEKLISLLKREVPHAKYIVFSAADATRLRSVLLATDADLALSKSTDMQQIINHILSFEDA